MWKPDVCLHHFPCDDGFAAAWVVNRKWPDVVLKGTNYGLPFPEVDIDGKNLLIADFSYKPDVLAVLAARAKSIVILDHHKTAEADLKDVNRLVGGSCENVQRCFDRVDGPGMNVLAEFDMARSGASLAWAFCFPCEKKPQLIRHIEDQDLWLMKLEHTRCLSLLLRSYPYDLAIWNDLMVAFDDIGGARGNVLAEAHAIERFYDQKLAEMLPTARRRRTSQRRRLSGPHMSSTRGSGALPQQNLHIFARTPADSRPGTSCRPPPRPSARRASASASAIRGDSGHDRKARNLSHLRAVFDQREYDLQTHANHWLTLPPIFFHSTPKPDDCDHDFQGWREFADGNGGEQVCTKCGLGAMAHTLRTGP